MALTTNDGDAHSSYKITKNGMYMKLTETVTETSICNSIIMVFCRYGEPYPHFYEGTLEEALGEACHKPAKDVSYQSFC